MPEPEPTSRTRSPGTHLEQHEHRRDRARLGVRLAVTDRERSVEAGAAACRAGQEPRPGHRVEGGSDRVHHSTEPRGEFIDLPDSPGLLTCRKQRGIHRATRRDHSGRMFFRVRASLTERPGALALLATRCGDAGLNILGLQIFPDLGRVTDELVISAPEDWTAGAVAELVSGAGGDEVSVEPCTTHDLIDQPTRWLTAAHDVVNDPGTLPDGDREAARCASREVERDRALPRRGAAHPGGVARRRHA